jgi:hypothetical protein
MRLLPIAACMLYAATSPALAEVQAEARNMALAGYSDLQGRSAYQPVIQQQDGRWIAYVGHHGGSAPNPLTGRSEANGTSVVDVTDPAAPRMLHHIPGAPGQGEGGGAQMARVCAGSSLPHGLPGHHYLLRTYGNEAHEVWDVTAPTAPRRVARIGGISGTHKNFWECDSGVAYLVSGVPGWRTRRMTQVVDLGDPARPRVLRQFGLPGQQPGASGPQPVGLHGAISLGPKANRVYFGHGLNSDGVLQIVDRRKLLEGPAEPTEANLVHPQVGRLDLGPTIGAHTALPLPAMPMPDGGKRDFVLVVGEAIADHCRETRQTAWMVDVSQEAQPRLVSHFAAPEDGGDFCRRAGRFGTHSSNESMAAIYFRRVVFLAHFNAGVRAVDVRDPYAMKEVGYYIPAVNARTEPQCARGDSGCRPATQTNNVEIDERGYIYSVDRAGSGMHVLRLTEDGKKAAGLAP